MKKVLKIILYVIIAFIVIIGGFALYISISGIPSYEPIKANVKIVYTPERSAEGKRLAAMLCVKCHLNEDGTAVSGKQMKDVPDEFGEIHSANITQDKKFGIGNWTDNELVSYLRTGIKPNGDYVPPYMSKLAYMSDEDIACIISWLHSEDPILKPVQLKSVPCNPSFLTKALSHFVFKPLPYPEHPIKQIDTTDVVAYGKYCLQTRYQCYECHSLDFTTNNGPKPELSTGYCGGGTKMLDYDKKEIRSLNITFDEETGIGKWSFEDFDKALRSGIVPNNQPALRYPMEPYVELKPSEVKAIYEYLKTIPKIKNKVDRGI